MQANVKLYFIFFLVFSNSVFAQKNSADSIPFNKPLEVENNRLKLPTVGYFLDWQTNSTVLTNTFLFDGRFDLFISQESVNQSAKKLNNNNYFVHQFTSGVFYEMPLKNKPNMGLLFELSASSFQDASFNKNVFNIVLFGNAHYRNEKIELGKMVYRNIEYQKIGIGVRNYFKARTQCVNLTVDFILGDYANQFKLNRGSVFTEQNGEYLDVDLNYERRTSSLGARVYNPKGVGTALNFSWSKLYTKKNATITVDVKNIGFVHYGPSTGVQTVDTAIHFTGLDLGAFSAISTFNTAGVKDSILKNFNIKSKEEAFNFYLPSFLTLKYEQGLAPKSILQIQANAYLSSALPMLKCGYLYLLKSNFYIGSDIRVGGYSKFDIDFLIRYRTTKIYIDGSINSVEGLISPKYNSGLGAFLHLGMNL